MKKLGILYICTGEYKIFWEKFYASSQKFLCPDYRKHWFVFTDAQENEIIQASSSDNVTVIFQEQQPWPYPTLLRFDTFLGSQARFEEYDYLFFFNANAFIISEIDASDIIPQSDELSLMAWPKIPRYLYTYDRNPRSEAYIPYNRGEIYVHGGIIGAEKDLFINVCRLLSDRIHTDIDNNVMARYHDESHLNRIVFEGQKVKQLQTSMFCIPEGGKIPPNGKIVFLNKQNYIDVDSMKQTKKTPNMLIRAFAKGYKIVKGLTMSLIDSARGR